MAWRHGLTLGVLLIWAIVAQAQTTAPKYLWIEGEQPARVSANLSSKHWYDAAHANLSGGVSLGGNLEKGAKAWAEYDVQIPVAGEYHLYVRKFWHHGPFTWTIAGQPAQTVDQFPLLDAVKLNGHVINWVEAGSVTLPAGKQTLRIDSIKDGPFVLDCLVLSAQPFVPNGLRRPGEKLGLAEPGTWAFEPYYDAFTPAAKLDLRGLNEPVAGTGGYIKANAQGDFITGAGQPIRFWCINTTVQEGPGTANLTQHARHLAKRGVNMVRHHGHLNPGPDQPLTEVNSANIDAVQKLVAVMKQQGIYTTLSPYWAHAQAGPAWALPGLNKGQPWGLLFWEPDLQQAYKGWLKELLTRPNPYDAQKTPLAKDPALAIMQLQNEDSLLFWTLRQYVDSPDKTRLQRLQARYTQWLTQQKLPDEKLNLNFWEADKPNEALRHSMRFLTETMYAFNQEIARYLRAELGYLGLVNAGNWRTASAAVLLDLERYSYTANTVIGANRYVNGGPHINPGNNPGRSGYALDPGDLFADVSVLKNPAELAVNARQVAGLPYIIPESSWVPPMNHQSEGPFLVAAYSSLNGVDGYYWFATGTPAWEANLGKWTCADPVQMGGFPAAALAYRKRLIKAADKPAVFEQRPLADLWALKPTALAEEAGFDPNRDTAPQTRSAGGSVHPLAYLVGPVLAQYNAPAYRLQTDDLNKYINPALSTVSSSTGELRWDYGRGVCTLTAPGAQGATGMLGAVSPLTLPAVTITTGNTYATLWVVSMDDQPLTQSHKILVQVTTQARPHGWNVEATEFSPGKNQPTQAGYKILATGGAPWNVVNTDISLVVNNPHLQQATLLDANGYAVAGVPVTTAAGTVQIKLPPNALYVMLEGK